MLKRNMLWLFLGSLLFQIVQVGAFPILIGQMLDNKGASSATIGLFLAVSWVVVLIIGPVVPRLLRAIGAFAANTLAFVFAVTGLGVLTITTDQIAIFVSAVSLGLSLIIRWINCDTLVVHLSDPERKGRTIGLHEALMGLGIALGPLLFVQGDLTTALWLAIGLSCLGQIAFMVIQAAHQTVPPDMAVDGQTSAAGRFLATALIMALLAAFISGFIEVSSIALFPLHFANVPFSLEVSAILVSSFGFGGTLLQPALGVLADRTNYAVAQGLCVAVILISALIVMAFGHVFWVALLALFLLGGAAGGLNTLAVIEAGATQNTHQIPAAMTAIAMLYTLGSIAGPVAAGFVMSWFNDQGMLALFCLATLGLAIVLLLKLGQTRTT